MATYFIGKNVGTGIGAGAILEQASSTARDVEVAINTTANVPTKLALLNEIQSLYDFIAGTEAKNW